MNKKLIQEVIDNYDSKKKCFEKLRILAQKINDVYDAGINAIKITHSHDGYCISLGLLSPKNTLSTSLGQWSENYFSPFGTENSVYWHITLSIDPDLSEEDFL